MTTTPNASVHREEIPVPRPARLERSSFVPVGSRNDALLSVSCLHVTLLDATFAISRGLRH